MITKRQAEALRQRIQHFEDAVCEDRMKGGGDPDDIPEIEKDLRDARRELTNYINRITKHKEP